MQADARRKTLLSSVSVTSFPGVSAEVVLRYRNPLDRLVRCATRLLA